MARNRGIPSPIWSAWWPKRDSRIAQKIENALVFSVDDMDSWSNLQIQKTTSGKLSHNYGKSPYLMGKSISSMAIFNSRMTDFDPSGKGSNGDSTNTSTQLGTFFSLPEEPGVL